MARRVIFSLQQSRNSKIETLDKMVKHLELVHKRRSFFNLQIMPKIVCSLSEGFRLRKICDWLQVWRHNTKLLRFIEKRRKNFIEDVLEGWKQRVAFKGGLSIHN